MMQAKGSLFGSVGNDSLWAGRAGGLTVRPHLQLQAARGVAELGVDADELEAVDADDLAAVRDGSTERLRGGVEVWKEVWNEHRGVESELWNEHRGVESEVWNEHRGVESEVWNQRWQLRSGER